MLLGKNACLDATIPKITKPVFALALCWVQKLLVLCSGPILILFVTSSKALVSTSFLLLLVRHLTTSVALVSTSN